MPTPFGTEKKPEKELSEIDKMKAEALVEIGRNPTILTYFAYLIREYNENIISSSKPDVLDMNKNKLIQWHSKKDQLEAILTAVKELKRAK